jgi:hypothetical protein
VCLDFVSRHLSALINTDGYIHMVKSCAGLQSELLQVMAQQSQGGAGAHGRGYVRARLEAHDAGEEGRRVRARREV